MNLSISNSYYKGGGSDLEVMSALSEPLPLYTSKMRIDSMALFAPLRLEN